MLLLIWYESDLKLLSFSVLFSKVYEWLFMLSQ